MPARQRELRRNYIGLLSDPAEEQRAVDLQAKSDHLVRDYFLGLIAAVLHRHGDAG